MRNLKLLKHLASYKISINVCLKTCEHFESYETSKIWQKYIHQMNCELAKNWSLSKKQIKRKWTNNDVGTIT
jgi:hypothetical protein